MHSANRYEYLEALAGLRVSRSTLCRVLKRMGFTRKKGLRVLPPWCSRRLARPVWPEKKKASCLSTDPSAYRAGVAAPPVGVARDLIGARTPQVPSQSCPSLLDRRAMKSVPLARGESDGLLNR